MLSIAVAGGAGRMGQELIRICLEQNLRLTGASERPDHPLLGHDLGAALGRPAIGANFSSSVADAGADANVWIDFTLPAATLAALDALPAAVRGVVIGTTGFSTAQQSAIAVHAQSRAIVQAGNFSLGIAMLCALTRQTAARLNLDWDIEIFEAHHRHKVDAPSGTALMLGAAAAAGRGVRLADATLPPHTGVSGPRAAGGIGFAVVRGGGIVGEHSVSFVGPREIVTLSHSARDRAVFADGAIAAAKWVADQPPGLYGIEDVLGL